jgi:hypothetical protein
MKAVSLEAHFNELLKIYADFSLREFRYKEGKTADIRDEAKRLCNIYKDQCERYVREHPEVQRYLFGSADRSLGMDEASFFEWQQFSKSLGSALSRMQDDL